MKKRRLSFADWCCGNRSNYGLEPSYVKQICNHMQRPEMRAIHSWAALAHNLKTHRSWLFWTEQEWERFMLTARCLWDEFKRGGS